MNAQTRTEIQNLLAVHGVRPAHRLGQHFLADANVTRKIVGLADVGRDDNVVEIGAGTGTLTRALAATGAHVVAYEIDERLRPILETVVQDADVEFRFEDITKENLGEALDGDSWTMVANLPYNVGTPLVMDVLRHVGSIRRLVVMVQREVAERFVARPGTGEYGLPSVIVQLLTDAELSFLVSPQVFFPRPRVESGVVVMNRRPRPDGADRAIDLARAGFGQRRKMLRRSLGQIVADPMALLTAAGIDPTSRPESLGPEDYLRLAAVVS